MKGYEGKEGYKKLIVWKEPAKLHREIFQLTQGFPSREVRRVSQMNDAARSAKQNLQEGYMGGTLPMYLHGIKISRASLAELKGDVEDCLEDNLISHSIFETVRGQLGRSDYLLMRLEQSLRKKQYPS